MPSLFFSYSHSDEALRDQLETQLAMLKHQGIIEAWHDRCIGAGQAIDQAIDERINRDEIILLLISSDFIASNYCYNIEMKRAMERHEAGEAIVIPVILRACEWHQAPFGKLLATPRDGKPVTQWPDRDEAFLQVAKAIRGAVSRLPRKDERHSAASQEARQDSQTTGIKAPEKLQTNAPRSAEKFPREERLLFRQETFEIIAQHFKESLSSLALLIPNYDCRFQRIDASRLFASIQLGNKTLTQATILVSSYFGQEWICYYEKEVETTDSIGFTHWIGVDRSGDVLSLGCVREGHGPAPEQKRWSQTEAAEWLWRIFIETLQSSHS